MANRRRRVIARQNTPIGLSEELILEGRVGHIQATRKLPDDKERLALVKWRGRSGLCSHPLSHLEIVE